MRETSACAAALLILLSAAAVSAQDRLPLPEVGGGYGGLIVKEKGGDMTVGSSQPGVHLRLTFPFTPRFSFEALTTISSSTTEPGFDRTNGLYIFQVKQRLGGSADHRNHAFLTYGAAGYYGRFHQNAVTILRPVGRPEEIVEYTYNQTDPPFFAVVGGGVQRELGRRVAFRADAQLVTLAWLPVAVRLSAGISLPIGDPDPDANSRRSLKTRR
jgi:hypothetical protein